MSPAVGRETSKRLMPKQNPQRRHIWLAAEVYAEIGVICSITIAVKGSVPVFARPAVVAAAVDVLRRHAAATAVVRLPVFRVERVRTRGRRRGTSPRPTAKIQGSGHTQGKCAK